MYIPTCAAKLDKEIYSLYMGKKKKKWIRYSGFEISANLRNFRKWGGGGAFVRMGMSGGGV
jgi:hypothetical protein